MMVQTPIKTSPWSTILTHYEKSPRKVRIVDNIMVSELLKQDGRVVGAVGFHVRSGIMYIFHAAATVIATGSSALKAGTYPVHFWTGDGEAMAYRAGAEIVSKEFMYGATASRNDYRKQAPINIR
jgi:succinate dehydrogenase/fumarate reductase flavoprotein subunit